MAANFDYSRLSTYDGDKPYIFVSYAHKDADLVLPTIHALQERGYRIWFDLGIEAGTEWSNNIAAHLRSCSIFLAFLSHNSVASENCLDEISFAKAKQKPSLMIFLQDDVVLPEGTEMQTARFQRMFRSRHRTEESFIQKICEATMLDPCREGGPEVTAPISSPAAPKSKPTGKLVLGICGALLLAAVILLAVLLGSNDENDSVLPPPAAQTEAPQPEALTMSDALSDFTFSMEGEIFQLPMALSELTDRGWTIEDDYCNANTLITGNDREGFLMGKRGRQIWVYVYNYSGNSRRLEECPVGAIEVQSGDYLDFVIAKGLTPESTYEEVTAALGIPQDSYSGDGYTSLYYYTDSNEECGAHFYISESDPESSSISLSNYVKRDSDHTETVTDYPDYLLEYQAPTELGDDIFSGTILIEGDLYQLPAPISVFLENGWTISSSPESIPAGNTDYISLKKGSAELYLNIMNFSDYQTTAENCAAYGLNLSDMDHVQFQLPGGLSVGSPAADVEAIVTEDFDCYSGSEYINYYYYEFGEWDFSLNIDINTGTNTVSSIGYNLQTWHYE